MVYSHLINFLFSRLEESEDSAPKETQGLVFSNLIVSRRINVTVLTSKVIIQFRRKSRSIQLPVTVQESLSVF